MSDQTSWILDFDSTLVRVEALDELAEIALEGSHDREAMVARIREITNLGMEGRMTIEESLRTRLDMLSIRPAMLPRLVQRLAANVTPSLHAGAARLRAMRDRVWVVSGGCHEWIDPVVEGMGLRRDHVIANRLRPAPNGSLELDPASPCAVDHGKATAIEAAGVPRPRVMVGDGMTDWRVRELGMCDLFVCFTEVVRREPVMARADAVASNLDEMLAASA